MAKKQFFTVPDKLKGEEMYGFNWLEYVTAIPQPLALVTGIKENGLANGTMQSWFCFSNENDFYCIMGSVNKHTHLYEIASKRGELAVNFPNIGSIEKCMETVKNNGYDIDELTASGLHYRKGSKVNAPIVDECFLNLECETVWEKELFESSEHVVLCLKTVNVWIDEEHYNDNKSGRYGDTGYLYNIHSPLDPESLARSKTCYGVIRTE
ncbi:MAG: flavin reductase [Ruminococcus sp.]|nr:flavin reductase [Ruminococcus sp.]